MQMAAKAHAATSIKSLTKVFRAILKKLEAAESHSMTIADLVARTVRLDTERLKTPDVLIYVQAMLSFGLVTLSDAKYASAKVVTWTGKELDEKTLKRS
jgi:hypothetical protein